MKNQRKLVSLILLLIMLLSLAACGQQAAQVPSAPGGSVSEGPPAPETAAVTVTNGSRTLSFDQVPQRVVCLNMQMTEMMLMLGLGDKVAYTCYTNAEPMAEIAEEFNAIPLLSEKYPSTEVLLGAEPDLVLGQRFGFTEEKAGTVEKLAEHGLTAYVSEGTLATEEKIENIYLDIENLGKIFRVEDRAQALIQDMKDKVAAAAEKAAEARDKVTVFVVDSVKENQIYTCAKSMETEVIKLAGGINVCENDSEEQWFYVSAETLIDKNPDIILFNQYGTTPVEEKIAAITANSALANVTAVKNLRFMTTVLQDVNESVRVADTVTRFAKEFYPELFS
ncbi:MAG: ABC transporter substrate-binding protein [Peptococcaceae bacterium]|nr:ABC transporter substrate-binding protein [Peptococcaceae bacterium]